MGADRVPGVLGGSHRGRRRQLRRCSLPTGSAVLPRSWGINAGDVPSHSARRRRLVSTWASERPLGLFGPTTEVLREVGMDEPYPRAFDPQSYTLSASELRRLLSEANLREVVIETVELDAVWHNAEDAVATVMGTPYAPGVKALP